MFVRLANSASRINDFKNKASLVPCPMAYRSASPELNASMLQWLVCDWCELHRNSAPAPCFHSWTSLSCYIWPNHCQRSRTISREDVQSRSMWLGFIPNTSSRVPAKYRRRCFSLARLSSRTFDVTRQFLDSIRTIWSHKSQNQRSLPTPLRNNECACESRATSASSILLKR